MEKEWTLTEQEKKTKSMVTLEERMKLSRQQIDQYNKQESRLDKEAILSLLKVWVAELQNVSLDHVTAIDFSFETYEASEVASVTSEANKFDILSFDYSEWAAHDFDKKYMNKIIETIKNSEPTEQDSVEYVWLTTNKDDMPIVVGRTKTNSDDLFKLLGKGARITPKHQSVLALLSTTTEKLILVNRLHESELDEYSRILREYEAMIAKLNGMLRNYPKEAFIIPLTSSYPGYKEKRVTADNFEQSLGDYLYKNQPAILNYYSHRNRIEIDDELKPSPPQG